MQFRTNNFMSTMIDSNDTIHTEAMTDDQVLKPKKRPCKQTMDMCLHLHFSAEVSQSEKPGLMII